MNESIILDMVIIWTLFGHHLDIISYFADYRIGINND